MPVNLRTMGSEVTRKNWFENHPKFKEIQSYGYYKDSPILSRVAMLVYLDLCEAKHWFSVRLHPCETLKLIYITGKPTKKTEMRKIVPLDIKTSLTMEEMQSLIGEVSACESEGCGADATEVTSPHPSVTLAFCESDSTIVYYELFDGLVPPDPPKQNEDSQDKRTKSRRRKYKRKTACTD